MRDKDKTIALMNELCKVWNDKDFVIGVCVHLKKDDHIQKMMNWLKKHENETLESDEVLLKALEIRYDKKIYVEGLETRI